jgi:hypothetical protein
MLRPNLLKISESAFASGLREVIEIARRQVHAGR